MLPSASKFQKAPLAFLAALLLLSVSYSWLAIHIGGSHRVLVPSSHSHPTPDRPLILYAYSESPFARRNIEFFIAHGLHDAADFVFIFNGLTDASALLPDRPNIQHVQRNNTCYDLGAHAEVLIKDGLWKRYTRFILMNSSIRGPFIPYWANSCWSERYLSKLTDQVKLVGMTMNCWPNPHVQSMIWALDSIGLNLLLYPPSTSNYDEWIGRMPHAPGWDQDIRTPVIGLNGCFNSYFTAVTAEVGATGIVRDAGYDVDVMLTRFHSRPHYIQYCNPEEDENMLLENGYNGINVHPFETLFMKTNRGVSPLVIERLTEWIDGAKYSSYDVC